MHSNTSNKISYILSPPSMAWGQYGRYLLTYYINLHVVFGMLKILPILQ